MQTQSEATFLSSSPTSTVSHKLRPYTPGVEPDILRAFNDVFTTHRSIGHWKWKFLNNPYAPPTLTVAIDSQNNVVGHYAVIPVLLNLNGTPVLVGQSVDTFVTANFRRHGVFVETANHCYAQCLEKGFQAVFGFPNEAAYPGRVRKLDWKRIGFLNCFKMRLSVVDGLTKLLRNQGLAELVNHFYEVYLELKFGFQFAILKRQFQSALHFQKSNSVPIGHDDLWNRMKSFEVFSLWKDAKYLRWRYDQNPDHQYEYYTVNDENNQILALAVVRTEKELSVLCEFLVLGKEVRIGRVLLLHIAREILKTQSKNLVFKGLDCGFYKEAFIGFKQYQSFTDVLAGKRLTQNHVMENFDLLQNWNIALGDSDGI